MTHALPRDLLIEILLWLVEPSRPHQLHLLSREHRCLACMTCFQLRGPMRVALHCFACLRPVRGLAAREHRHLAGPACVAYALLDDETGATEYTYNSVVDRVHCADCLWQATLEEEEDDDDFERFFDRYG